MSHLTTYKSNVLVDTNKNLLSKALEEIGITLNYDKKVIKNSWITETVDASFSYKNKDIAVGLKFNKNKKGEEEVTLAGDFYGTGLNQSELINKIAQVYQKHNVLDKCKRQHWNVKASNIIEKDGKITILAERYA